MLCVGCGGIYVGVHGCDELPYAKNLRLPSHILFTATVWSTHPKSSSAFCRCLLATAVPAVGAKRLHTGTRNHFGEALNPKPLGGSRYECWSRLSASTVLAASGTETTLTGARLLTQGVARHSC